MTPFAVGMLGDQGGRPVRWAATGRWGGCSTAPFDELNLGDHVGDDSVHVAENRRRARDLVSANGLAVVGAVHGSVIAEVVEPGTVEGADGLVTRVEGLALLALGADCALVALADASAGVVGVLHCGWLGLVRGAVPAMLDAMSRAGAMHLSAVIGPSICAPCYPVPAERIDMVRTATPTTVADAACPGSGVIDVGAGVRAYLVAAGIDPMLTGGCTAERADLFSYRRDGVTGRQGMIVVR